MSAGVRGVAMRWETDGWRRAVEGWCAPSLVRGRLIDLYDESDVARAEASSWSRCLTGREAVVALRPSRWVSKTEAGMGIGCSRVASAVLGR
jgi:hypothetical protein